MSATYYRSIAATLDRVADDVLSYDSDTIAVCRSRLPGVLQGAATDVLLGELDACSSDLAAAAAILTDAATAARATAVEIEAAEAAAVALEIEDPEDSSSDPSPVPFF